GRPRPLGGGRTRRRRRSSVHQRPGRMPAQGGIEGARYQARCSDPSSPRPAAKRRQRVSDGPEWFSAKRYGYGTALPISWQGWVVMAVYFVVVLGAAFLFARKPVILL